jgi:glycosyltransferase involved in cell wall biosynthesis
MAVGKPIITESSMATETMPADALIRISPNSAEGLIESILMLKQNQKLKEKYSERSREVFETKYSEHSIGQKFKSNIIYPNNQCDCKRSIH